MGDVQINNETDGALVKNYNDNGGDNMAASILQGAKSTANLTMVLLVRLLLRLLVQKYFDANNIVQLNQVLLDFILLMYQIVFISYLIRFLMLKCFELCFSIL